MSLKQSLSLLELEQHLSWIRAEVEAGSERPLPWYMLADDENALADQVTACRLRRERHSQKTPKQNTRSRVCNAASLLFQAFGLTENDLMTIRLLNETRDMLDR